MSHSRIFDEYAKIMSEKGLVKTADKKDEDYNIVPDKAGPDTKVEKSGYELVEIAHPEQIQVAESRLNDGIVENGVERQKVMIDVALRNPRGVIAAVMQTLVKAANALDSEMSEESLKIAKEIDGFLEKLAREALSSEDIFPLVEEVLSRFGALDFTILGFGERKAEKETVYQASRALKKFLSEGKTAGPNITSVIQELAAYVKGNHEKVTAALANTRDWGSDADEAREAWDNLKTVTDQWYQEPEKAPVPAKEMGAPGVASKKPAAHFLKSDEVGELQQLLGFAGGDVDKKFGPKTFGALQSAAKNNSLLAQLMENMPKSYQGWKNENVGEAINRIRTGNASAQKAQEPAQSGVATPYQSFEEGYQGAKMKPYPKDMDKE